nr:hypothetical protein CFP56_00703 [Quercus suber]
MDESEELLISASYYYDALHDDPVQFISIPISDSPFHCVMTTAIPFQESKLKKMAKNPSQSREPVLTTMGTSREFGRSMVSCSACDSKIEPWELSQKSSRQS